jgi:hypothetical protein
MKGTSLYCYAWDLAGTDGRANQSTIDSLGLDGITLATSYHAGKFIRPGSPTGKVVFPEDGTVYFRPHRTYRQLQPVVSQVTIDEDVLATLTEAGQRHVVGWTVLLHNTRLGYAHPDVVVRNAWGDPAYYSLCPAQPAVQEYAVRLCGDLAEHYDLAGLALETPGFLPFVHGYHHEFAQLPGNPWMNILLGLCFCDACMAGARNAGIDVAGIAHRLKDAVHGYMSSAATVPDDMAVQWLVSDLVLDPEFSAFLRWRCQVVTSLVEAIRQDVRQSVPVAVIPSVQRPSALAWSEGTDLAAMAKHCDGLEIPFYEADPGRVLADVQDCRRRAGPHAPISAILRPGHPDMATEAQLQASISALAGQDVRRFSFYNFGMLRPHNLEWIRSAAATVRALATEARP